MKNISECLIKVVFDLVVTIAKVSVNTTCNGKYYQEKLDEQCESLKIYRDE